MISKRIIGSVLITAVLLSGCSKVNTPDTEETAVTEISATEEIKETEETKTSETSAEKVPVPFEFNPHVYSPKLAGWVPQENWDAFYNLCDALREGKTEFECSNEEAYEWATRSTTLANLFPAACMKVEGKSEDGSAGFENGIGKICYNMPPEEYVARQADFEAMITGILNSTLESDDTEYEMALKLYLYIAENYDYDYSDQSAIKEEDGYVYRTFKTKLGQCINYGSVYAYLLLQAGIDAMNVGCFEEGMDHAWTYAVIDGKGYHIDTTWALKSCYTGIDHVYLDYFMMSDEERNSDGCLVRDLTMQLLKEFWVNRTNIVLDASDASYCIRDYCGFYCLDEDNKILTYVDMYGEMHEFYYGDNKTSENKM